MLRQEKMQAFDHGKFGVKTDASCVHLLERSHDLALRLCPERSIVGQRAVGEHCR
jgi:hypothetical protein